MDLIDIWQKKWNCYGCTRCDATNTPKNRIDLQVKIFKQSLNQLF